MNFLHLVYYLQTKHHKTFKFSDLKKTVVTEAHHSRWSCCRNSRKFEENMQIKHSAANEETAHMNTYMLLWHAGPGGKPRALFCSALRLSGLQSEVTQSEEWERLRSDSQGGFNQTVPSRTAVSLQPQATQRSPPLLGPPRRFMTEKYKTRWTVQKN